MSGAAEEQVRSAVPIPDLSAIDAALAQGGDALREAVKRVRPADLGRDLSRRPLDDGAKLLAAIDDRRGAAMLKAAHPSVAGRLIECADTARAAHALTFLSTDQQTDILGAVSPETRAKIAAALDPGD